MWKSALFLLLTVLSTVRGSYSNGLGVSSWDEILARLMENKDAQTGICGNMCYLKIGQEKRLMDFGEQFTHDEEPCLRYVCESSGVKQEQIQCPETVTCDNGPPVRLPRQCCQTCGGPSTEGGFEEWGKWTECSRTCGGGKRARERTCSIDENGAYLHCTGALIEIEDCNTSPCPVSCEWKWGEFGQCSATCGGGRKRRFPVITQHAQNGGRPCPTNVLNEVPDQMSCNTDPCPVNCVWHQWNSWSQCSATCGGGSRTRTRGMTEAMHGGDPCVGSSTQTEDCNSDECPVDCRWKRWRDWGPCSKSCEGGISERMRGKYDEQHGGRPCTGKTVEYRDCNVGIKCEPACKDGETRCDGVCIPDKDGDCVRDNKDNCPEKPNPEQDDEDGDGVGNLCDNCIYAPNDKQENSDNDGLGDNCDDDDDNDGFLDQYDNCPYVPNPKQSSKDPGKYGDQCSTPPSSDKTGLAAEIMKKLLDLYYSN